MSAVFFHRDIMFELIKNGTRVYTSDNIKVCTDPVILAHFADPRKNDRIIDIGCGCGIIGLTLRDIGFSGEITALDIDEEACMLTERGSSELSLPFNVICGDVRTFVPAKAYDIAVCNPPYFNSGIQGQGYRGGSRHDDTLSLSELFSAARLIVKDGGRLVICIKPDRMAEAICLMKDNGFETKRMRFCRYDHSKKPWLVLLESRLHGGVGLTVENDFIAYGPDGIPTEEYKSICFAGMKNG